MTVNKIADNLIEIGIANRTLILVSYITPVAAFIPGRGFIKTEEKHSRTTAGHIKGWVESYNETQPQKFFDDLLEKV